MISRWSQRADARPPGSQAGSINVVMWGRSCRRAITSRPYSYGLSAGRPHRINRVAVVLGAQAEVDDVGYMSSVDQRPFFLLPPPARRPGRYPARCPRRCRCPRADDLDVHQAAPGDNRPCRPPRGASTMTKVPACSDRRRRSLSASRSGWPRTPPCSAGLLALAVPLSSNATVRAVP
jgi:hypothetical protein